MFLLLNTGSYAQFLHQQNAQGDPLTEIVDPNGMKQGSWNFVDVDGHNFRTEMYRDHVLTANLYKLPGASVDVAAYRQRKISELQQKQIRDLAATLAGIGHGEILILDDNSVFLHVYVGQLKDRQAMEGVDLSVLKAYSLQRSIILF